MARIRKLTPRLLKKIINEEKLKISKENLTKLALQEIKVLLEAKRIRKKRRALKRSITKRMK